MVYGGGLVLLLQHRARPVLLALIPPAIAVVIGLSQLAVHVHVPAEVVLGGAIGVAGAAVMVLLAGQRPKLRVWPTVIIVLMIVALLHGHRLNFENTIHSSCLFTWLTLPAACHA